MVLFKPDNSTLNNEESCQNTLTLCTEDLLFNIKHGENKMALFFTSKMTGLSCVWIRLEHLDPCGMWTLTKTKVVEKAEGSVSPWRRAGNSSGKASGENLCLFLSSSLTSSLQHTKPRVTTLLLPSRLVCGCHKYCEGLEAAVLSITKEINIRHLFGYCVAKFFLPRAGTADQTTYTHPARHPLHVW